MYKLIAVGTMLTAMASGQTFERRAVLLNGGNPGEGQCTIEVVVDGAAEVQVRGGSALLKNLSGQPPQWRRFECTSILPANPADFRFEGVDGRGRQQLVGDPRNGGTAVVRIEDTDNGSEGYTFRLLWRGPGGAPPRNIQPDSDLYHQDRDQYFRGSDWRSVFFQRIREDLDHVTSGTYPYTGDRARLARTERELDELQDKLSRGFYDQQELDEVIGAMRSVLQGNRLTGRDRSILTDDLRRMQDFRVRHDDYGARADDARFHTDRDRQFSGGDWRANFFQRIRQDLDHASLNTTPFGGDSARLSRTQYELDELQGKLARGYYDERELDEVMSALQAVVDANRLRPGDRDILSDDLGRMRDFRQRHEQYGAR